MRYKIIFILLVFLFPCLLFGSPQEEVTLLRWVDPSGSRPGTFREWILENPYTQLNILEKSRNFGDSDSGTVAIFTEQSIYNSLISQINQLITQLQGEGYMVLNYVLSGGTPDSLRNFLQSIYSSDSIEGVLFIGNLPISWYQVENDFYTYGYAEWPIDLYYMDLDGTWLDTLEYNSIQDSLLPGSDSIYDTHYGDVAPEIYVGRLMPTGIGNDTLLLKNYFHKDSCYRNSINELQHRALVYVDDDWEYWVTQYADAVALLYSDTTLIANEETTRAVDYDVRIDTNRAWVSVFAHSWSGGHQFTYNYGSSIDYFYSYEYTNQDPPSNFYNYFACSFCRYTTNGYGGGRSIFNQSYGVGAIGSTKTGSMLEFEYFYQPLGNGENIGEGFRDWFAHIAEGGFTFNELCWHYGMTLLGDPFLKPTGHIFPDISVFPDTLKFSYIEGLNIDTVNSILVYNKGNDDLNVDSITGNQVWITSINPDSFVVSPGDSLSVEVTVIKDTLTSGTYYGLLMLSTNDPDDNMYQEMVRFDVSLSGITEYTENSTFFLSILKEDYNEGKTLIKYSIPYMDRVIIDVYDILGNKVRNIVNSIKKSGQYEVIWNGRDKRGNNVPDGIYFIHMKSGNERTTEKLIIMR